MVYEDDKGRDMDARRSRHEENASRNRPFSEGPEEDYDEDRNPGGTLTGIIEYQTGNLEKLHHLIAQLEIKLQPICTKQNEDDDGGMKSPSVDKDRRTPDLIDHLDKNSRMLHEAQSRIMRLERAVQM